MATLTLASPAVCDHHFGVMLPVLTLMLPAWMTQQQGRWEPLTVLGVCYALIATNPSSLANHFAAGPLNFLQSYRFFAGIAVLTLLHRICRLQQTQLSCATRKMFARKKFELG
jgi:hypothetical protein